MAQGWQGPRSRASPVAKLDPGHRRAAGGGGDSQAARLGWPAGDEGLTDTRKEALLGAGERSIGERPLPGCCCCRNR